MSYPTRHAHFRFDGPHFDEEGRFLGFRALYSLPGDPGGCYVTEQDDELAYYRTPEEAERIAAHVLIAKINEAHFDA